MGDAVRDELPQGAPEFRLAAATGGRTALEVAVDGEVVAVDVATAFSARVLGALRGGGAAREGWTAVWGCLPRRGADLAGLAVEFGRAAVVVPAARVGPFWVARSRGRFAAVTVREAEAVQRWRTAVWRGAR